VYFIDLDGVNGETPRHRVTTLVGYNHETVVARATLQVPVSSHPINAVNLKDPRLGLYAQVAELIERHGVTKGRVRLELDPAEHYASLTVNEYETLLMQHDLAEVLRNPLRFAAEKARHAWNDPRAVPGKALDYAKYDLVRFLRMKRSVDLLVSDTRTPGEGAVVEGTYQTPIMVQWRPAPDGARAIGVTLTRFQ
jgi:hypothetical protein